MRATERSAPPIEALLVEVAPSRGARLRDLRRVLAARALVDELAGLVGHGAHLLGVLLHVAATLRDEIAELEATRDGLADSDATSPEAIAAAQERADTLGILAGTERATGPGIRLHIEDGAGQVDPRGPRQEVADRQHHQGDDQPEAAHRRAVTAGTAAASWLRIDVDPDAPPPAPDDALVLVWQHRFGTDELTLECPGGVLEPGEDPVTGGLRELVEETGTALIMITHDLGVVAGLCDEINVLYGGRLVERADRHDLFAEPRHPYTSGLLASVPSLDGERGGRLNPVPGSVSDNLPWTSACAFAPPPA